MAHSVAIRWIANNLDLPGDTRECPLAFPPGPSRVWSFDDGLTFVRLPLTGSSSLNTKRNRLEDHKLPKPNYQFEKRKRDMEKKAKKAEKKLRKLRPSDPAPPSAEAK
jgi:hypothetical protein